ncbi:hypothetical protein [Archangium sp.]|uniref:hypothetical protein n=1 Tax=Archangium sp. TaxID=1872627 RepID=UPI00286CC3DE|nr:hypothetical protein [Archangium sp.]
MAVWMCVWVLGVGPRARAETDSLAWRLPSNLEEVRAQALDDDDGDDDDDESCGPAVIERRQLVGDVFEYSYRVRVGLGAHDVITLHRVAREVAPGTPARALKSVFLVHGDVLGFRAAFLASVASGAVPREQSIALFLAQRGVEVWGIDLRWVNVPPGTTDFSFMKGWNLGLHARDVGTGMLLARRVRACGGNGSGRMALLGWSRGATISYAYLNAETRLAPEQRQVSGFIPVDMPYVLAPRHTAERQAACQTLGTFSRMQASGQYEGGQVGALLQLLGSLAITAPDGASPIPPLAGLTNRQAGRLTGSATYALQNPPILPVYHWTGGQFALGLPSALSWTRERFFFDALVQASPYQSIGEQVDTLAMWCGAPDVPYDDYLREVKVPVLYVGAAGGSGDYGLHSLGLLGSTDVKQLVVKRLDADRALDYGHSDLLMADDAAATVWTPVLDWLRSH